MPELPPLPEPIDDGVVALREISNWDIPEILVAFQDDPDLASSLGLPRPPSGAELGRQVEAAEANRAGGREIELTVVRVHERDCLGRVRIGPVDWEARTTPADVWLVPEARDRGLEARALTLARDWLAARADLVAGLSAGSTSE